VNSNTIFQFFIKIGNFPLNLAGKSFTMVKR
jgi:hypothetical protein